MGHNAFGLVLMICMNGCSIPCYLIEIVAYIQICFICQVMHELCSMFNIGMNLYPPFSRQITHQYFHILKSDFGQLIIR